MRGEELLREYVGCFLSEAPPSRSLGGSDPNEAYDKDIGSDDAYKKRSAYVPDEDKDEIDDWIGDMGMSTDGKKRVRSK